MNNILTFLSGIFVLSATCYLLFITSEPLEEVGNKLGKLLHLPEDVIASTFAALSTSGPEIIMAILAASPFIANEVWSTLELGEKACSGTLNMAFSSMDNLLGIGAVAIIFMIYKKTVNKDDYIPIKPSTIIGLLYYILASGFLCISVRDNILSYHESWCLMIIGIVFVLSQFIIPPILKRLYPEENDLDDDNNEEEHIPKITDSPIKWGGCLFSNGFQYIFLTFALIVFTKLAMGATFDIAKIGIFSVGGILLMFTSYVSSFPEFMMSYRYAIADKKDELLGMLFGSNVIDLAFAGFRSIWLKEPMRIYTTGKYPYLLNYYIWMLPIIAIFLLFGLITKQLKWKHSYILFLFYLVYVISGLILL